MAIGWLTALKLVPWSDVIEAAPAVVSSARKFLNRTRQPAEAEAHGAAPEAIEREPALGRLQMRIADLESAVSRLNEEQQASAALIQTLAEQNARLVQALEVLRKRLSVCLAAVLLATLGSWGVFAWLGR